MPSIKSRLPPANSLVSFEAAARLQSITRAARELCVTREAVSRQIRLLEQSVGTGLFERSSRSIALTPAGKELFSVASAALENIARCADVIRNIDVSARVSVTATFALSAYWLAPRLWKFCHQNPKVDLRIRASDTYRKLSDQGIDVGIWYGDGEWLGVRARHLFDITSFPVCSPTYLSRHPELADPNRLLDHVLLHLEGREHSMEDWDWWFSKAKIAGRSRAQYLGFDNYPNVIQAALAGQGIALGYSTIIKDLLDRGDLVRPTKISCPNLGSVYIVTQESSHVSMEVKAFCEWVRAEAKS
jgi:LysR family transcriptional regulator, glycine cleavage system transcriptional activator